MSSAPEVNPSSPAQPSEAEEQVNNHAPDIRHDHNHVANESIVELNTSVNEILRLVNDLQGRQRTLEQTQANAGGVQFRSDRLSNAAATRNVRRQSLFNMPNEFIEEQERDRELLNGNIYAYDNTYVPGTEPERFYHRRNSNRVRGPSLAQHMGYADFDTFNEYSEPFNVNANVPPPPDIATSLGRGALVNDDIHARVPSPGNAMPTQNPIPPMEPMLRGRVNNSLLYRQERDCNIKLEKLSCKHILKFMEDIHEFERQYEQSVTISFQMSRQQIDTVVNKLGLPGRDYFHACTKDQIYSFLQDYMRPEHPQEFFKRLNYAVKDYFIWTYEFSIATFRTFHIRMLDYVRFFRKAFIFLAHNNEENIPSFDSKEYGIRKAFCDNFPNQYATIVCDQLQLRKCRNLKIFLHEFCKKAAEDNDFSLEYHVRNTRFTKYKEEDKKLLYSVPTRDKRKISQKLNAVNFSEDTEYEDSVPTDETSNQEDLSDIPKAEDEDNYLPDANHEDPTSGSGERVSEEIMYDPETEDDNIGRDLNNVNFVTEPRGTPPSSRDAYKRNSATTQVLKMTPLNPKIKKGICLNMQKYGVCTRPACEYSHDPKELEASLEQIAKRPWLNPPPPESRK